MGAFAVFRTLTYAAVISLVLTAVYYLWALERAFFGELNPAIATGSILILIRARKLLL
jgi:NADH:ubiquinone oxidoreductase subunit 4 (subunit M)